MKEKYVGTLEDMWGKEIYLYTMADSLEKAKKNLEYQKSQKEELGMFRFKKVEKEIKEDTSKEEVETKEEEREIIKKVSFLDDRYFVSNMGRIFSNKAGKSNDEFVELTTQNNKENKKEFITLVKKDGSQSTYRLDGLVYRTFTGDTSQRLRLIHIDGDMLNNKLSNLKKAKEDKSNSKTWVFPEEELRKYNKEDLIDLLKRMCM